MTFVPAQQMQGQRWRCAVTGRSTDDEGFFDTHRILEGWDQPVHLSAAAVKEYARELGWVAPADIDALVAKAQEMGEEIQALNERLDKIDAFQKLEAELTEVVV